MAAPRTPFGRLSAEDFLRDNWQRRPLLVRGAMPGFVSPLTKEDLLELASDEEVTARLILETAGDFPWEMRFGPFLRDDFAALPPNGWTVLVQEADRHDYAVADLLAAFRFLPNWRIDDVQVSYAPPGGSAGPHVDNYDVFLLQGYGERRWRIDHTPAPPNAAFIPDLDVHLLQDFTPDAEWVLSPGDMLYLPPRIPHWGVAVGDCMTYSIGFRAPGRQDIVAGFLERAATLVDLDARFSDRGRRHALDPGLIDADGLGWVRGVLEALASQKGAIDRWFGAYVTEPRRGVYPAAPEAPFAPGALLSALTSGARLRRSAVAHFAYIPEGDGARLFVGGEEYALEGALASAAPVITGTPPLGAATLAPHLGDPSFVALLTELVNAGYLVVQRDQH